MNCDSARIYTINRIPFAYAAVIRLVSGAVTPWQFTDTFAFTCEHVREFLRMRIKQPRRSCVVHVDGECVIPSASDVYERRARQWETVL